MKKILIVVDMQNDFVKGVLGTIDAKKIVQKVLNKVEEHYNSCPYLCLTKDTHSEDYLDTLEGEKLQVRHCIKNTLGWKIIDELREYSDIAWVQEKNTFGYMNFGKALEEHFGKIEPDDVIELIGVCTDICVVSNALILRATFPNNKIVVDASCCAGTTTKNHLKALDVMDSCQIDIINREE